MLEVSNSILEDKNRMDVDEKKNEVTLETIKIELDTMDAAQESRYISLEAKLEELEKTMNYHIFPGKDNSTIAMKKMKEL